MKNTKLVVIGGFLGSGKTTAILKMAAFLRNRGNKVGIVTNDQGSNLVDTNYLKEHGFPIMEVTGGCFCCNFDQLTRQLAKMSEQEYPDYILAEPVGSCTDLISTIMKPIRNGYAGQFTLAPLSILCDPLRLKRFLNETESKFPNEINYLFSKQLEEAELIILNKCDRLSPEETAKFKADLTGRFPGIEVLPVSAKSGAGVEEWAQHLLARENTRETGPDIRYDTYAAAEASLGWFNLNASVQSVQEFDANALIHGLADGIRNELKENQNEIAHLKIYVVSPADYCKISCVSVYDEVIEDKRMDPAARECNLIINIRAFSTPEFLSAAADRVLRELCGSVHAEVLKRTEESFYPGYPKPKYRM